MLLVEIFLLVVLVYDKIGVNAQTKLQNLRGVADVGKNSNYLQFPESENPISGQPPLIRPNTKSCTVPLFHNVSLYYYSEVVSNKFQLPAACPPSQWNTIILSVSSFEQGTQYDRVGGLWVNDQELLRTTTPEPTSAGINWFIEKDVTIYGNYFASQAAATSNQSLTAYVSIPNNVDSTYTGIIYLDASITFYVADDSGDYPPQSHLPIVLPLTKAPTTTTDLFSAMQVTGEQELKYNFTLPTNKNADWVSLIADIYASGHGCEEFYYSNLPSVNASDFGFCGGGIYREVQVFIDDAFAGSVLPFPVIYTGGVNPFLWRPLTGIMSFDIPSHRLDLTPFLGYLYDGKQHTIRISVYGNNVDGFWYLDASLLLIRPKRDQKSLPLALGAVNLLPSILDTGVHLEESTWRRDLKMLLNDKNEAEFIANEEVHQKLLQTFIHYENKVQQGYQKDNLQEFSLHFYTFGSRRYNIIGNIIYIDGTILKYQVEGRQQTENTNSIIGTSLTRTFQNSSCITESKVITPDGSTYTQAIASFYPLYLEDYYAEDATSFDMQATVAYAYDRLERGTYQPSQLNSPHQQIFSFELAWRNHMLSNATYNRTTDHTTVYKESDSAIEVFDISNKYTINSKDGRSFLSGNQLKNSREIKLYRNFVTRLLEWQPKYLSSSSENADAAQNCFHRSLTAKDGSVTSQNMNGTCSLPAGMTFCGYGVCGAYNAVPLQQVKQERRRINRFPVKHETTENRPLIGHSISSPSPVNPLVERTVRLRNHKKSHHRRSRQH